MPRCDMEQCPNWSGDHRVCDCTLLPLPPDEDDDRREDRDLARADPLFNLPGLPDWFDDPIVTRIPYDRWWENPDAERAFAARAPSHMAVTPWFRSRPVEDVHLPDPPDEAA